MTMSFWLLALAGGLLRAGINYWLHKHHYWRFTLPSVLAASLIVLAGLPDLLKPITFPFPLSLTLGFLIPDLVLRDR